MIKLITLASSSEANAHVLQIEDRNILLDCGLPYKKLIKKLYENGMSILDIDLCLISHNHDDHSRGLEEVEKFIDVIKPQEKTTKKVLKDVGITQFSVFHGEELCNAFVITYKNEKVLYITDYAYCEYRLEDLTCIITECNYIEDLIKDLGGYKHERQMSTHMSLEALNYNLKKAFDLKKCKSIYLTHLSDSGSDELLMKSVIKNNFGIDTYVCQKYGGIN